MNNDGFLHYLPLTQPPSERLVPPAVRLASGHPGTVPSSCNAHGSDEKQRVCKLRKDEKAASEVCCFGSDAF